MKLGTALLLSVGMMLASLSPVNAGTPNALVQAHHQRCGKPVFYAQTVNHKRRSKSALSPRRYRIHSAGPAQNIRKWTLPYRHTPPRMHTRATRLSACRNSQSGMATSHTRYLPGQTMKANRSRPWTCTKEHLIRVSIWRKSGSTRIRW